MPYAIARNEVSNGAIGLLRLGFGLGRDAAVDESLRQRFLEQYAKQICVATRPFLDAAAIEALCRAAGARWGIVTNKPAALTEALLAALQMNAEAGCIVAGDTLPQRKPHPAPLLHAAALLGIEPGNCVYIGDARRDIEAGTAAGMQTIAAAYGYIRFHDEVAAWGAHRIARSPAHLHQLISELVACAAS
jgi:phosphoglycolate phosphatase